MRKIITLIIIVCMLIPLFGCGAANNAGTTTESNQTEETLQPGPLDGKKIIFIGNSHTHVGNVVTNVGVKKLTQEDREHDKGLFYLLCKQLGNEVNVVSWTFGNHGLASLFGYPCSVDAACKDQMHENYLTDRKFDYVVIQPGVGENSEKNIERDINYIVDFFRKANPDVKFVLLGNASVYGNNKTNQPYLGIMKYYKTLDEKGFIMADWGKLVNDLIHNTVTPEGSSVKYNKSTFIVNDGFHPNYLCGYIASVMTYCAITGESAADIPADMFQNSAMVAALDAHLAPKYNNPDIDTNCKTVLTTQSELEKIHQLIDKYLAEKPHLNY